MTVGEIIQKALLSGHRRFLAKIHPDYFMGHEIAIRQANEELIRFLERPISLLGDHWHSRSQDGIRMSSKPTTAQFYTKSLDDALQVHNYNLPFSESDSGYCLPQSFLYHATYSLFGLFQVGDIGIDREVLSYVEAKMKDVAGSEYETGRFSQALFEHHSTLTQQPEALKISTRDLTLLASKEYIQLDSDMTVGQKKAALLSLVRSLNFIEELENQLSFKIPVFFISPSTAAPFARDGSIHLPTEFSSQSSPA
jgi:hypothetical protein